jgi:hypothetical protein
MDNKKRVTLIASEAKKIRTKTMKWTDAIKKASANLKKKGKI